MELVRIPDRETGGWEFEAEAEIGHVSTKYGDPGQTGGEARPRWGVNKVWRLGGGRYALYRASWSIIYHTDPTPCRVAGPRGPKTGGPMGSEATAADLPDDAEPCWDCKPPWPEELAADAAVRYEFPRQSMDVCDSPEQVITRLTRHRKFTGEQVNSASGPARALIAQCRAADPDFGGARMPMQRIS